MTHDRNTESTTHDAGCQTSGPQHTPTQEGCCTQGHQHSCGCHHHHHHHHHHGHDADEVFVSWGTETVRKFGEDELSAMLSQLDGGEYGLVLRAKGIVPCTDGGWIHFDYTPGEQNIRKGPADYTGRLCVIGSKLADEKLAKLFGVA